MSNDTQRESLRDIGVFSTCPKCNYDHPLVGILGVGPCPTPGCGGTCSPTSTFLRQLATVTQERDRIRLEIVGAMADADIAMLVEGDPTGPGEIRRAVQRLASQRDARTQEAAQAQARVKEQKEALRRCERWLERAVRFAGDPLASEATPVLAAVRQSLSESPPTAALDAAIAKAREEEREKLKPFLAHSSSCACGSWNREYHFGPEAKKACACGLFTILDRAAGLREGGEAVKWITCNKCGASTSSDLVSCACEECGEWDWSDPKDDGESDD